MYLRILKKDLRKKKTMNLILFLFITMATTFIASSASNLTTLTTSLNSYLEMADAPDFCITVTNDQSLDEFYQLAAEKGYDYYSYELLQFEDESGMVNKTTTNVLSTLDNIRIFGENGDEITKIQDGEVYVVSNAYHSADTDLSVGTKVNIVVDGVAKDFTVKGYVYDALLGSPMVSIDRYFISESDFAFLRDRASVSCFHTVNVYTKDPEAQSALNSLDMTFAMFITPGALRLSYVMDMLVAAVLLVVSLCLILISMMVLRFTIGFTMSQEFREIGCLKAIGISCGAIRGLYIAKYLTISTVGGTLGFVLSIPFGQLLLQNASQNILFASRKDILLKLLCSLGTVAVVTAFCFLCTRRIDSFSPIDAIRRGETGERYTRKGLFHLNRSRLPVVPFMSLNDITSQLKQYISMLVIFILGLLLVIIPLNTVNTLQSGKMLRWMDMAECDLVVSQHLPINYNPNQDNRLPQEKALAELRDLLLEQGIQPLVFQELFFVQTISFQGKRSNISSYQGIGDVTMDDYLYVSGSPPQNPGEVAISHLLADTIGAGIGDQVEISWGDLNKTYTVTAITQTMANLGLGLHYYNGEELDYRYMLSACAMQIRFTDDPDRKTLEQRIALLEEAYPEATVYTASEYTDVMISSVAQMIDQVKNLILAVVLCINVLVAVLMVKSFITKERGEIAILKAIGFKSNTLAAWQALRIGLILVLSMLLGALMSTPLTELIISPIFQMMGAYSIDFEILPLDAFVRYPLLVLAVTSLAAFISAQGVRRIPASEVSGVE